MAEQITTRCRSSALVWKTSIFNANFKCPVWPTGHWSSLKLHLSEQCFWTTRLNHRI